MENIRMVQKECTNNLVEMECIGDLGHQILWDMKTKIV